MQIKYFLKTIVIFLVVTLFSWTVLTGSVLAQSCGGDCSVAECGSREICINGGVTCWDEPIYCTACGGNGCQIGVCPPGQFMARDGCRDIGSGGGGGGGGGEPSCNYGYIQNCPAGYIRGDEIINTSQVYNSDLLSCSNSVGTAQTLGGCAESYIDSFGWTQCTAYYVYLHRCYPPCTSGATLECSMVSTGQSTTANSCFSPYSCGSGTYVSHYSSEGAGFCYLGRNNCANEVDQTECEYFPVWNVYTTCNTTTEQCTCVSTCTQTAPTGLNVVAGSTPPTSAVARWTLGTGGEAQFIYVGQNRTKVEEGCLGAGDCILSRQLSASATAEIITGLSPGTTYYFRVINIGGPECNSTSATVAYTTPADNTLSGRVFLDTNNNCSQATPWSGGGLSVSLRGTAYNGSVGSDGRFSFAAGSAVSFPYLDLAGIPASHVCSTTTGCNSCPTLTSISSPSSSNFFYITPSREAWWQAVGGSIYANGSVRSEMSAGARLIEAGAGGALGALMRSGGTLDTGAGLVSSAGYSAQTKYSGKTTNYDFFAAQMGVTNSTQNDWGANTMNKPANNPARDFYYINPTGNEASVTTPWAVASGESYVIFVNGDLRIASTVTVAPGGFVAFIVNGNLNVSPAVAQMQGLYVVDGVFASETNGTTDTALAVEGSVVAWGGVSLGRDLDSGNITLPGEKFTYRPDLITNMPDKMKVFSLKWEEVVPGTFDQ